MVLFSSIKGLSLAGDKNSGIGANPSLAISTACSYADWVISILREGLFVEIQS